MRRIRHRAAAVASDASASKHAIGTDADRRAFDRHPRRVILLQERAVDDHAVDERRHSPVRPPQQPRKFVIGPAVVGTDGTDAEDDVRHPRQGRSDKRRDTDLVPPADDHLRAFGLEVVDQLRHLDELPAAAIAVDHGPAHRAADHTAANVALGIDADIVSKQVIQLGKILDDAMLEPRLREPREMLNLLLRATEIEAGRDVQYSFRNRRRCRRRADAPDDMRLRPDPVTREPVCPPRHGTHESARPARSRWTQARNDEGISSATPSANERRGAVNSRLIAEMSPTRSGWRSHRSRTERRDPSASRSCRHRPHRQNFGAGNVDSASRVQLDRTHHGVHRIIHVDGIETRAVGAGKRNPAARVHRIDQPRHQHPALLAAAVNEKEPHNEHAEQRGVTGRQRFGTPFRCEVIRV